MVSDIESDSDSGSHVLAPGHLSDPNVAPFPSPDLDRRQQSADSGRRRIHRSDRQRQAVANKGTAGGVAVLNIELLYTALSLVYLGLSHF